MMPQVRNTFDLEGARRSYFTSLFPLNPGCIVPSGPTLADLRFELPAGRGSQELSTMCHLQGVQSPQPALVR